MMDGYITYNNTACPYPGIKSHVPIPLPIPKERGLMRCRNVHGGINHDYYREVA